MASLTNWPAGRVAPPSSGQSRFHRPKFQGALIELYQTGGEREIARKDNKLAASSSLERAKVETFIITSLSLLGREIF